MRWYVNDISLQAQFEDGAAFAVILRDLISARASIETLRNGLRSTRTLLDRHVGRGLTLRQAVQQARDRDLLSNVLIWLDRTGPFVDEDRLSEADDYFEYRDWYVTDSGLGEAARRAKAGEAVAAFSFIGVSAFEVSPLAVDHGLPEQRLGKYDVENYWTVQGLTSSALSQAPAANSWQSLVEIARQRFPRLAIPDTVYQHPKLVREPFNSAIRDRALILMGYLNDYMAGRMTNGVEGPNAQAIVQNFFVGERALFSGESQSNQRDHRADLTFSRPGKPSEEIFGIPPAWAACTLMIWS